MCLLKKNVFIKEKCWTFYEADKSSLLYFFILNLFLRKNYVKIFENKWQLYF